MTDTLYLAPGVSSDDHRSRQPVHVRLVRASTTSTSSTASTSPTPATARSGRYSIIFGSLGNATPFDFVKEVQVKTGGYEAEFGQSMGGVVNVVTKSGTNALRGSVFGYARPKQLEGEYKTVQTGQRHGEHGRPSRSRDIGIEAGGRIVRDRLFFFGAINPSWQTRTFIAPEGNFPLESLGEVDRERRTLSYSAKATYQAGRRASRRRVVLRRSVEGRDGAAAHLLADGAGHLVVQRAGRSAATTRRSATTASSARKMLVEASFARAYNKIAETPSVDTWRVTDQTGPVADASPGGIGGYEAGQR